MQSVLQHTPPRIMGILNVTPDSFYDGGFYTHGDDALFHCEKMINEGADIIDIGGESTRPGATAVSVQEELERVATTVELFRERFDVLLSIDTRHVEVMETCLQLGADWINDVQALTATGAIECVAKHSAHVCLMHMLGEPQTMQKAPSYDDVVSEIKTFFSERIEACLKGGINPDRLMLDVGFGFGKTLDHQLILLNQLHEFSEMGYPLLIGLSRKSMFQTLLNLPIEERLPACLAATALAVYKGASVIRTHDVKATRECVQTIRAIQSSRTEEKCDD
jgi:dihydropteroate synthase